MIRPAALAVLVASAAAAQPVPATAYQAVRLDTAQVAPRAGAQPEPLPDEWIARDKAMHAGASFLLTLSAQYVLTDKGALSDGHALPWAAGSALALGLLKEAADARRPVDPHWCWRDLAADAAGVALAAAVVGL